MLCEGDVCISCTDRNLFVPHSNESIYGAYDRIAAAPEAEVEELQKLYGINLNPGGIINNQYVRSFFRPRDHMLRDWMHMLVNAGVANIEAALLINPLEGCGIAIAFISAYIMTFTLPKRAGKVESSWVSRKP